MTMITTKLAALLSFGLLPLTTPTSIADDRVALQLDRAQSHVVGITRKSGIFGFLGHEHAVLAPQWTARFVLDPVRPSKSTAEITIAAEALEIDSARARQLAEIEGGAPDADDIVTVQKKMLGPDVLDAAKHPTIRFRSTAVDSKEKNKLELKGTVTIHGVARETTISVTVEPGPDETLKLAGTLPIRLTDHGIDPPSTAGVGVKNEMEIRFSFRTRPTTAVALNAE